MFSADARPSTQAAAVAAPDLEIEQPAGGNVLEGIQTGGGFDIISS
jgi:hypothetical protein